MPTKVIHVYSDATKYKLVRKCVTQGKKQRTIRFIEDSIATSNTAPTLVSSIFPGDSDGVLFRVVCSNFKLKAIHYNTGTSGAHFCLFLMILMKVRKGYDPQTVYTANLTNLARAMEQPRDLILYDSGAIAGPYQKVGLCWKYSHVLSNKRVVLYAGDHIKLLTHINTLTGTTYSTNYNIRGALEMTISM